MRFKSFDSNSLVVCLLTAGAVCPGFALAAAQTPTQAAPATQTTTPANQAAPANSSMDGKLPAEPAPLTPAQIIGVDLMPSQSAPGSEAEANPTQAGATTVTLDEALQRARKNEPTFAVAVASAKNAQLDKSIARAAALPTVIVHNQYLFTQSAGADTSIGGGANLGSAPRFIANNSVHEYVTQASATETIGLANYFEISRANALAAVAKAQLELSRRGLNSTVISLFYAASTTQGKVAIQQRALDEARDFLKVTKDRETAREVAHADVLKAELTEQQRQRDLADAQLAAAKAKLDLAVLLFPDPATAYTVVLPAEVAPPPVEQVNAEAAAAKSPQIASANASLLAQNYALGTAQAAYLPELSLNYSYGIDSTTYAIHAPDGNRNLGYSASATLDLPIFDWFATPNRIRAAHNLRDAAKVTLSAAQRTQAAQTREFYNEVQTAYAQLDSLKQSVAIAQESLRLTRLRYTSGEATVLEVTDAENTLATTETALNDGTTRYQLALANLQILTGTI